MARSYSRLAAHADDTAQTEPGSDATLFFTSLLNFGWCIGWVGRATVTHYHYSMWCYWEVGLYVTPSCQQLMTTFPNLN